MAAFPYVHIPTVDLPGPVDIQPFGPIVAGGIVFASWMVGRYARRNGLDEDDSRYLGIRVIIWGLIACHVFNTFFYEWDRFMRKPWILLNPLDGISSWGGVIGGGLAVYIYARIRKLDRLRWGDWGAYGAIAGWVPGRLACALVHDHVGGPTSFALGVDFPAHQYPFEKASNAVIRAHDLGLYEFLILLVIFAAILLLERWKGRKPGFLLAFLALTYSVPRFFLEFLRMSETDPRYGGLTFAQWASILGFIGGLYLVFGPMRRPQPEAVATPAEVPRAPAGKKPPAKKKR